MLGQSAPCIGGFWYPSTCTSLGYCISEDEVTVQVRAFDAEVLVQVLHNTSSKSPQDLVSRTSAAAEKLTETASERQQEELSKYLTYMKVAYRSF